MGLWTTPEPEPIPIDSTRTHTHQNGPTAVGYLAYALKYLSILLNAKVRPYLVFDGITLPSKATLAESRRINRQEAKKKALTDLNSGNFQSSQQNKIFALAVSITSTMVLNLVHLLRLLQIPCIRAPYEADSQIAYLYKIGVVDGVLAEDSDFILYGVDLILTKFNLTSQTVKGFNSSRLDRTPFSSYSAFFIRDVCILSGCDYLKSVRGIGLKTAIKYRSKFKNVKETLLCLSNLQKIDSEYLEGFLRAWLVFSHHVIYDSITNRTVPLNDWDDWAVENFKNYFGFSNDSQDCAISFLINQMSLSGSILPECCGQLLNPDEGRGIAEFLIDTKSLISFDFDPLSSVDLCLFIQSNNKMFEKIRSIISSDINDQSEAISTHRDAVPKRAKKSPKMVVNFDDPVANSNEQSYLQQTELRFTGCYLF
ncbi:hypothetical protein RCL1_005604 [Eukaryota sp. TZLM3-RCL]